MNVEIDEEIFTEMCKLRDAYKPEEDIVEFINETLHHEYLEEY